MLPVLDAILLPHRPSPDTRFLELLGPQRQRKRLAKPNRQSHGSEIFQEETQWGAQPPKRRVMVRR